MDIAPLRKLLVPFGLTVAALMLRQRVTELPVIYAHLIDWLPYMSLGGALLLCLFFNNSRLFASSLSMLLIYYLVQIHLQAPLKDLRLLLVFTTITLALPLTQLVFLLVPERGLTNRYGLTVTSIVSVLAVIIAAPLYWTPVEELATLAGSVFAPRPFAGIVISLPAAILHLFIMLAAMYRLLKKDEEPTAALAGMLLFSLTTFAFFELPRISTVMFSAAGLAVIGSMLARSYNMAFRDELTGLLGRRALNERMKALGRYYAIAMMDVDHFKKFNDAYGHDTGDDVLKMVGKHINAVGGGGIAYRYGGEEFCILFPGKNAEHAIPFLEIVRKSVENHKMIVRNLKHRTVSSETAIQRRGRRVAGRGEKSVSVTISIGVAEPGERLHKPEDVLKAADGALYIAKKDGRNCIRMPED